MVYIYPGNCKTNVFQLKFLGRNKKFHPILTLWPVETFYSRQNNAHVIIFDCQSGFGTPDTPAMVR